ncbi:eukaryotic translation initiation factor 3 subunit J [Rhizoctonia solani AG-3 Rhs1AP]|uniref:Eukaryotic translation initiation factor 3 subunit J n=2 Tax=Rhizoctonia solani AG-3 TaxID=1086053 RepID=A0A074RVP3_9AGAM|nr:eukaryotic translation initiation factor 3 subunit J [Rhizoctonia solani AG-3 Rhs1AP]KEP51171.1 eukaryotic translation initiation factor 3 subunit J [Rhizoctonia solani 123E]
MGDNWDDSASDTPAAASARPAAPVVRPKPSKWADEDEEIKPASDWDASSDDEPAKPAGTTAAAPPKKKKGTIKSKIAEKEAAAANARRGAAGELDPEEWVTTGEGAGLSVAELRARELESDLKNTTDLLGAAALGDAPSELAELATFNPRNKEDFQRLSDMIIEHVIQRHQSKPLYATFVDLHVRALAESLRDVDIRKAASTLSTLANEKQKEQRDKASGKKKPKAALKPVLGAAKVNNKVDTSTYDEPLDDFGNDDFM